jgi:uncharacterized protein YndB with AHSA1/START domain
LSRVVEASAIVQLSPQQTWELLEGDEMRRVPELSDSIVAIEDYRMRPDGTPRYVHVGKMGPAKMRFTADYSVFEPPRRIEATILDSPFGGAYRVDYEEVPGGTRVTHHWEVEPQNAFFGLLLPVVRPLIERSLQRDLQTTARRASRLSSAPSQEGAGPT